MVFYKVDVDKNSDASAKAGITCMPTFKFFKGGELVKTIEGADLEGIKAGIESHK